MPRPKDVHINAAGDIELGPTGDIACACDDTVLTDGIVFRLKTYQGDYGLEPGCGASLEDFVGEANTRELGESVKARVLQALTHDAFIDQASLQVDVAPMSPTQLLISITVPGTRGAFTVLSALDLLTGKIDTVSG